MLTLVDGREHLALGEHLARLFEHTLATGAWKRWRHGLQDTQSREK
jgi:hypothetical protein